MPTSSPPKAPRTTKYIQQGPDDECKRCAKYWRVRGKDPKILVEIGKANYGTPIVACPWCDGPVVAMQASR